MLKKISKLFTLILSLLIVLIFLYLLYNKVYLKYRCSKSGGEWEFVIQAGNYQCNMPVTDAGKPCEHSNQCESRACVRTETDIGKCYEWKGWQCARLIENKENSVTCLN